MMGESVSHNLLASQWDQAKHLDMGEQIIRQCHHQMQDIINLDELRHLLGLQTAIYAYVKQHSARPPLTIRSLHDSRHTAASELVRLLEASYVFTRCATKGAGKTIAFDLGKCSILSEI
jgi:hypothetical protein